MSSGCSDDKEETADDSPASTPSNLTATALGTTITVDWDAVGDADSYTIYWGTSSGVSSSNTAITSSTDQYSHTGLSNGATYYYKVSATNSTGSSSLSSEAYAIIIPSAPSNLTATASGTTITVDWNAASGASSYRLYWGTSSGVSSSDTTITSSTDQYTHSSLTPAKTYYYQVLASNATGDSSLSSEVSATIASTLEGTWKLSCYSMGSYYVAINFTFSDTDLNYKRKIYSDSSCTTQLVLEEITYSLISYGSSKYWTSGTEGHNLTYTVSSSKLTPTDSVLTSTFNYFSTCSSSDWTDNVSKDVSGQYCAWMNTTYKSSNTSLYGCYGIYGSIMEWCSPSSSGYPSFISSTDYTKQ